MLGVLLILGVYRGYVALWRGEDPEPEVVTRVPAAMLPEEDRRALERGLVLPEGYSPARALEDYCS